MAKKKRKMPGLNTSSTADISFMLLIFFLVTTSMDTDRGLARQLPPPPEENAEVKDIIVKERNILNVRMNSAGNLMLEDMDGQKFIRLEELRAIVKDFIANPKHEENKPEFHTERLPYFGDVEITKNHVISVQNDRGTPYKVYFNVQHELIAAYNELRDEISQKQFGKPYAELNEDQQKAVRDYYPQKISEAEPKNYGGKK
ncbi:MAG: biopolymer transporter ExbD [Bacteroidaceae bacterium]|jgi:biopolymer transport protein ExbD|nr:biopolymer transporter ExbD [Bacteroidaceae bacterium]